MTVGALTPSIMTRLPALLPVEAFRGEGKVVIADSEVDMPEYNRIVSEIHRIRCEELS